ncbi:CG30381, partial [Drosophila busckii]
KTRKLMYTLQFDYPPASMNCEFILSQPLPAGVYISTDELQELERLKKLSAVYPKFVDIEIITENAKPFNVLLRGAPKITETLVLPIHFRYHAASDKRSFNTVSIGLPELFINCPLLELEQHKSDQLYCLNESQSSFEEKQTSLEANGECNWQHIDLDIQLLKPLRAEIPVGNAKAYPFILYATILLSWAMSIWTVLRTQSVPKRLNQQLNEQRNLKSN